MQDQRDLMSCCIDVLIGPAEDNVFAQMANQTKEYSRRSKEEKETMGSPHLLAFVGMLTAIIDKGPSVGQANHEAVKSYMEQVKHMQPAELNEHVRLCKQAKCYNMHDKKIFLELSRCPVRGQIIAGLVQMGFTKKGGRAPPSHLERDLVDWLQHL